LEVELGKVTMIATDGHRIAIQQEEIDDVEAHLEVLIPKRALSEVAKFVGNDVVITNNPNHIKFESGNRVLISRKLTMNFPDYRMALPKDNEIEVVFDASEMVKALRRVVLTADENSRAVKIELQEEKMLLSATSTEGESEEIVKCVVTNYPDTGLTFFMNCQYLTDFLAVCDNPAFKLKNALSAVEVLDNTARYVAMPLRAS
jgi:DNA polymerase-3 subunit beta